MEVSKSADSYSVDITATRARPMMLHWAINGWELPPEAWRPEGTIQVDGKAVQTPFAGGERMHISFPAVSSSCWNAEKTSKEMGCMDQITKQ